MGVSENSGTPKSSILIGFSITNDPFWGTPIFGNTHMLKHAVPSTHFETFGFEEKKESLDTADAKETPGTWHASIPTWMSQEVRING